MTTASPAAAADAPSTTNVAIPGSDARDRLLRAADAAFYEHGIKATGVHEVARRAGVTKRTLYYHFRSKDDLIDAYIRGRNDATLVRMIGAATSGGASFRAQLAALFAYFARRPTDSRWNGCAMARAAMEFSDAPAHAASLEPARHKKRVERWLASGARRDDYANPTLLARQLIVLVDGAATQMTIHRDGRYAVAAARAAQCLLDAARPDPHDIRPPPPETRPLARGDRAKCTS